MGLDMYLEAEVYVPNWNHSKPEEHAKFNAVLASAGFDLPKGVRKPDYAHVYVEAAYWRKANAIHAWFVDNVQDGRDECQRSYVSVEQLQELVKTCERILATVVWGTPIQHEGYEESVVESFDMEAVEELSPRSGFFFGSVELDNWYFESLKDTVEMLQPWIEYAEPHGVSLYYQASW